MRARSNPARQMRGNPSPPVKAAPAAANPLRQPEGEVPAVAEEIAIVVDAHARAEAAGVDDRAFAPPVIIKDVDDLGEIPLPAAEHVTARKLKGNLAGALLQNQTHPRAQLLRRAEYPEQSANVGGIANKRDKHPRPAQGRGTVKHPLVHAQTQRVPDTRRQQVGFRLAAVEVDKDQTVGGEAPQRQRTGEEQIRRIRFAISTNHQRKPVFACIM